MPVRPRQTIRLLWPPHKHTINSLPLAHPGDRSPATTDEGQIRKWFVTGGNMLVIVHNIAVRKLLFTTNSLTFGPLRLLEVDPHPHEWRNLEDKWSVTSRLIEPIYPSILSQWIYRLSVQTQSHKSLNSDSFMFGDPLMRVGESRGRHRMSHSFGR